MKAYDIYPELVFERLIGNVSGDCTALQKSGNTTKALKSEVDKPQKEIKALQTPDAAKLLSYRGFSPTSTLKLCSHLAPRKCHHSHKN